MAAQNKKEQELIEKAWAKVVARAWSDEAFKRKLLSNPAEALKEYGLKPKQGKTLKFVESSANTEYCVLPQKSEQGFTDEEMKKVVGGANVALTLIQ